MKVLSPEVHNRIAELAQKYSLKTETVETLLVAILDGDGRMAQFNLPELGGLGQWMKGGLTMTGDIFNPNLKVKVEQIAEELASLVSSDSFITHHHPNATDTFAIPSNLELSKVEPGGDWPNVFGSPTASGSQNNFRYAYFASKHRLVVEEAGKRSIYDTKHYHISGIAQQQGVGQSYRFSTQEGVIALEHLSVISQPGEERQKTPDMTYDITHGTVDASQTSERTPEDIILSTIEKLNMLFEKGQITEEEYRAKKAELLSRI